MHTYLGNVDYIVFKYSLDFSIHIITKPQWVLKRVKIFRKPYKKATYTVVVW